MVPFRLSFLSVFILIVLSINNINCAEDKTVDEEANNNNEESSSNNESEKKFADEDYDEIGERFLSLLSENLRFKILKNKAANEGLLDKDQFKREPLTKAELDEVQQALVQSMQPLFGQFVKELAINDTEDTSDEKLQLDPPKVDLKKKPKVEDQKKSSTSDDAKVTAEEKKESESKKKEKLDDVKEKKSEKVKSDKKTAKDDTKKEKTKKDGGKEKEKPEKVKEEKKTEKQKEEL